MNKTWPEYLKEESLFQNAIRLRNLVYTIQKYVPKGSKILEAGFGSGTTAILLADLGYRVTAVDINKDLVNRFRNSYSDWIRDDKLRLYQANMFSLPFRNNEFDLVYHQGVLEHFSDKHISQALSEQRRVSKLIIFDVPNNRSSLQSFGDERLLPPSYWKDQIRKSDLMIVKELGRGFHHFSYILPHAIFSRYALIKLNWFSKRYGLSSIFVCK